MGFDQTKIQLVIDKMEIRDALARYCRGLDRHDVDMMLSAYHPDAREQHGAFDGTPAEYGRYVMEMVKNSVVSAHQITNVLIEVNGDIANSEAYVYVIHQIAGDDFEDHIVGRYLDRFEKRNGDWRIAHRLLTIEWSRRQPVATSPWEPLTAFVKGRTTMDDPVYTSPHLAGLR